MPIEIKIPLICLCIVVYGILLYTDLGSVFKIILYKLKKKKKK